MNPGDEEAEKTEPAGAAASSANKSTQRIHAILENSERARRWNAVGHHRLHSGKRRRSRGFVRFIVAICLGIGGTLAWQSYGDATKQIIATRAPDLGWSPEAKQMIASSIQWLGWTKPPVESKAAAVAQTAPETVALKPPAAPSFDPAQVQQMAQSIAAMRQTVEQLAAGQGEMARNMAALESAVAKLASKK
jgi:hypothetical protein